MKTISVLKPNNDSLEAQLISLHASLKGLDKNEKVIFDLGGLKWACPLLVLPLSAYINRTGSQVKKDNCGINYYFDAINFPAGLDSVSEFRQLIQKNKTYIPINVLKRQAGNDRERLESLFSSMVLKSLGDVPAGTSNAIYHPIGELVTNIFEHSKQDSGYIFGQIYPKKNYLDICVVDTGRGLKRAYREEKNLDLSEQDSIKEVMIGNSVKPGKERGYGVRTSRNIVCDCLNGNFALLSGSVALVSKKDSNKIANLSNFYWQGVIVAYRMPKPTKPIDIMPYLE